MARGAESKEKVTKGILSAFEGAFVSGKEIRIPMIENGELVQIKVVLTAAKTNIEPEGASTPTATVEEKVEPIKVTEPTNEEKENLLNIMAELGL